MIADQAFPLDVLTEDGNPTGETVLVTVKQAFPSGDTLYEDAQGTVYVSRQSVQRSGGIPVVTDEQPEDGEEQSENGEEQSVNPEETGDFEAAE